MNFINVTNFIDFTNSFANIQTLFIFVPLLIKILKNMYNQQRSELDSFNRVFDFNRDNEADLNSIPDYNAVKEIFNGLRKEIIDAGTAQSKIGITNPISKAAKKVMADIVTKYCLRAKVKAILLKNTDIADLFNGSASQIFNANKTKAIQLVTIKRKALFDNKDFLGNISTENFAEIDQAIAAYDKIKDAPTESVQTKSTVTDQLPALYNKTHDIADCMYDLIYSYYNDNDTKKGLVEGFEKAKHVIKTGVHSTSITFNCLGEEETPIHSFTVTDKQKNKTVQSDENGIVTFDHHLQGKFHFTISAPDSIDVDFVSDIKKGTNNHFTVHLKRKPLI